MDASQIATAIKKGVSYRDREIMTSKPITVIGMRPRSYKSETLSLGAREKLAHDAGSILLQSPMVSSIRKSGMYGFDPVLRGFKYDQINIVINGAQCAVAACPNRMDPPISQIAPNMMEHVEIIKGPHSFRYGNSIGGTINFKTAETHFPESKTYYGRWSSGIEISGNIFRTEGMIGKNSDRYDFGIFGSFSNGDDYKDGNQNIIAARFQRTSIGLNFGMRLSDDQQLLVSGTGNLAKDVDFPALPMDLRSDETYLYNIQHTNTLNYGALKSWNTTLYTSIVDHAMDNLEKKLNPRKMDAETDANTISYGGRTEGIWQFESSKIYSGFDLRIESADGERRRTFLLGPQKGISEKDNVWNGGRISKIGMFSEYHKLFPQIKLVLSGRMTYEKAEATDLDPYFAQKNQKSKSTQVHPGLSIGGISELGRHFSAGIWLGHARRGAGITERYINSFPVGLDAYDMLGNPQLKPEVNNQLDINLNYRNNNTEINLGLFSSFLKNYISSEIEESLSPTMPSSPGVRRYININEAFMSGFELKWMQNINPRLEHHLNIAYTFGEDKVRNNPLPEIAPLDFRYSLRGNFIQNSLHPSLSFRYVMQQDRVSENFGETRTPSFSLLDFRLSYQITKYLGTTMGIQNILDEAYYEHLNRFVKGQPYPIYDRGRNFFFSIFIDMM
jgi:iron complex outermembrane receptor protein